MGLFRKLFGEKKTELNTSDITNESNNPAIKESSIKPKTSSDIQPEIILRYRKIYEDYPLTTLNDMYFEIMEEITSAKKAGNIPDLLMHSQASFGLFEPLIKYNYQEYGDFRIKTIPALENALIYFAVNGNTGQLKNIKEIVDQFEDLQLYRDKVEKSFKRRKLAASIYKYVKLNPESVQSDLKDNLDFNDGRFISTTIYYMVKAGKISKNRISHPPFFN